MDHSMHHESNDKSHDHSVHGMLLFGEESLYLSHLPMFMTIHGHQVILEVTLAHGEKDAHAIYRADRLNTGERVYTLVPEEFSLHRLGAEGSDALRSFQGTVYRGHFENGGVPILEDVTVHVVNVIHFLQFDPHAQELPELQYLLFGHVDELYMAHLITKPPDFDQIVSVTAISRSFSEEALAAGVLLTFPQRENRISERLRSGERTTAQVQAVIETSVMLETAAELYLEEGELDEKPTFETTDEERATRFP
jgi:hypothetical protein